MRKTDAIRNPQFWAEDGSVFFLAAWTKGVNSLLEPSAGYYHTMLRLVALLAQWVDPVIAPAAYALASLLVTLYVAALTLSPRFSLAPSFGYALAVVLVPDAFEVLLNLTNLQWILALGLIAILLSKEPTSNSQRRHDHVAVALLSLTGPFSIMLAPLFAWRAWRSTTAFNIVQALIVTGSAGIQLYAILHFPADPRSTSVTLPHLAAPIGTRLFGSLFTGALVPPPTVPAAAIALALASLVVAVAFAFRPGPNRVSRLMLFGALAGLLAASLYRCRHVLPSTSHPGFGARYFFPLQAILLWLIVDAAAGAKTLAWVARAMLVLALAFNLHRLREPPLAEQNWAHYAARIRAGETTAVRINPDNWEFIVPGKNPPKPIATREGALVNVSVRAFLIEDRPALAGVTVLPGHARSFLVRAIGPSLKQFGVTEHCHRPRVLLQRDGASRDLACETVSPALLEQAIDATQAFRTQGDPAEVSTIVSLLPGSYIFNLGVERGDKGEGLLEIYELADRAL